MCILFNVNVYNFALISLLFICCCKWNFEQGERGDSRVCSSKKICLYLLLFVNCTHLFYSWETVWVTKHGLCKLTKKAFIVMAPDFWHSRGLTNRSTKTFSNRKEHILHIYAGKQLS